MSAPKRKGHVTETAVHARTKARDLIQQSPTQAALAMFTALLIGVLSNALIRFGWLATILVAVLLILVLLVLSYVVTDKPQVHYTEERQPSPFAASTSRRKRQWDAALIMSPFLFISLGTGVLIGQHTVPPILPKPPTPTAIVLVSPTSLSTPLPPTVTVGLGTPPPTPYPTPQSLGHPPTATPKPTVTPTNTPTPFPTPTATRGADPCPYDQGVYYQTVDGFNSSLLIAGDPTETASVENQIASRFTPCQNYGHQAAAIQVWSYVNSDTTTATKQADAIISLMQNLSNTDGVFVNTHYSIVTAIDTKNYAELDVTWGR